MPPGTNRRSLPPKLSPTALPQTHILDVTMLLEQLRQSRDQITGRRLDVVSEHELNRHIRDAVLHVAMDQ